jgi:archaemetzincin
LKAIATPMPEPKSGDWLAVAPEDGQSFAEYKAERAQNKGRDGVIYLVAVGAFDEGQQRVFDRATEVTRAYYQSKVQVLKPLDAEAMRKIAEPRARSTGEQWLAPNLIEELKKIAPKDSVGLLGITAVDLYPDPEWNFVFGQADNVDNVGVMSMARYGDPKSQLDLASRRMSSVAVHELGHMFGVSHCVAWRCAMNGANSQVESDATPLEPCPADFAKFTWYFGFDPHARTQAVHDIYLDAGFVEDAAFAEKELLLTGP